MLCLETTPTRIQFLTQLLNWRRFDHIHNYIIHDLQKQKFRTDALNKNLLVKFCYSSGGLGLPSPSPSPPQPTTTIRRKRSAETETELQSSITTTRKVRENDHDIRHRSFSFSHQPAGNTTIFGKKSFSIPPGYIQSTTMINLPDLREMALKFIDIGANLTDAMFQGVYHGTQKHQPDLDVVLHRAWTVGLEKMIITVGSLREVDAALHIANKDERLYITMGCHPTRCQEFAEDPVEYYEELCKRIDENRSKVIAIGECGLDYERLQFCDAETQRKFFEKQLDLAAKYQLPLFLHCRGAHKDFVEIIERNRSKVFPKPGGVVHSFDGTLEEVKKLIELGFYIGINGCSLKTCDNLDVVKEIPIERIMIETDCPWCGIRPTHASAKMVATHFPLVKKREKWTKEILIDGRSEPCQIIQVVEVIATVKREPVEDLADLFYSNTMDFFFNK